MAGQPVRRNRSEKEPHLCPEYSRRPRNLPAATRLDILLYILLGVVLLFVLTQFAHAGGPKYVAGSSFFDSGIMGTPLTWEQGSISYYTDQGSLSQFLSGAGADALVADAFSQWTSIPTAAIAATHAGQLAEDVNGTNVYRNADGSINLPADIQSGAVGTPVGVVYDADGSVTDALLGQGAGDADACFSNAAFGGVDNFASDAYFQHALIILNGNCAQNSSQTSDVEYRLVRVLGRVLGLDWSQTNLNVITGNPPPSQEDYAGFTIMHAIDPYGCVPISSCYPDPYTPKMDDRAAISRLYPVTSENVGNFSGKEIFSANTARIHGTVYFTSASGQAGQGMQGANVVARWINPATGLPDGEYTAASVSGFLFSGNAGNMVTGFNDPTGDPLNEWGSSDTTVEGSYDLAGLEIPDGGTTGQYELTVENIDPLWSETMGPYGPWQVQASGQTAPIVVNVALGQDTPQDILMQGTAQQKQDWYEPTDFDAPAAVPMAGDWAGSLSPYGNLDYFWMAGQANRTLSVLVTALDPSDHATESKAQPVVGMWALSDPEISPAPANTPVAFNSSTFGLTLLNAQLLQSTSFRIGIADMRGDGRPDYRYQARVLYGDHVTPTRASVAGGTALEISGLGFRTNVQTTVGSVPTSPLAVSAAQIFLNAPAQPDGIADMTILDPPTGASSVLTGVLAYGAGPTDTLRLLSGGNPATPVGGQAPNPIRVEALAADGVTPVPGASVYFTSSPGVSFSACSGATSCTVVTDETGQASTFATVLVAGVNTITAQLAPASYQNPQQVQATLLGTESGLDLSLNSPNAWIAQGAAINVALVARVLSNGSPLAGRTVSYYLTRGSGTLNPGSAKTDGNGYATSTLGISSMTGDEQVSVCVEPGDAPCKTFYGTSVPPSSQQLVAVSGDIQLVPVGQDFQAITVRVTDSATPPNPVRGCSVMFEAIIGRSAGDAPIVVGGDLNINDDPLPILLGSWEEPVVTDNNGLAKVQPSTEGFDGALAVIGLAAAGTGSVEFGAQSLWPPGD